MGDLLTHDAKVLDLGVIRSHPLGKRVRKELHHRQRIANLMGDLRRKETERRETFTATQALLDRKDLGI